MFRNQAGTKSDLDKPKPTGQDRAVGKEVRDKGLLRRINEILKPEGYALQFLYSNNDDHSLVGPFEIKIVRNKPE